MNRFLIVLSLLVSSSCVMQSPSRLCSGPQVSSACESDCRGVLVQVYEPQSGCRQRMTLCIHDESMGESPAITCLSDGSGRLMWYPVVINPSNYEGFEDWSVCGDADSANVQAASMAPECSP